MKSFLKKTLVISQVRPIRIIMGNSEYGKNTAANSLGNHEDSNRPQGKLGSEKINKPVHARGPHGPSRELAEAGGQPPPPTPPPVEAANKTSSQRKAKTALSKREKTLKIRVTKDEDYHIRQNKPNGQSLANWARETLLCPSGQGTIKSDPELIRQIAWSGNNLNQIAKAINTHNAVGTPFEIIVVADHLHAIRQQLNALINRGQK
ncbi:MobC family plasmid mobilization relaxosome protein [Ruficoccus sp. ZRK36]|uniref:MobC family plasmid mobilization relaxosome protein n=1 Tax=Ruficoccus sp. ZRK36 TaxID=2866311 RepID=UPI001C73518F|nr:MobC family plasmid mobilization relaxosome protein [Ruficoccus sp. ZRK36]QYY34811.1 MobC family plasmid mobilization relaxosome protein [Ruficoccus sp. ZRK36]